MKKRVFVGIAISPVLTEKILLWREKYWDLPVRWLAEKNLHITLVPPWYTEDIEKLVIKLLEIKKLTNPFTITLRKVTFGPERKRPRLIWAEGEAPRQLQELKGKLEKILEKPGEKRELRLHLTLARFRPEGFSQFRVKNLEDKVLWRQKIRAVTLFSCRLSPRGADYEKITQLVLD